ncbi:MAG: putative CoA-substrate-specific enzyme activase [Firmicutes bacterium]|nr:putative CoA-substrate-specific enzyme activase [Bacillota bacterium]
MPQSASLGVDIGSVSTKGVVVDQQGRILASEYLWTEGDPISATKKVISSLHRQLSHEVQVRSVGTTGSARRLIGTMLEADVVKNEITAHARGTLLRHPDIRTIIEIGGQDSKIILISEGVVTDYAMNTLCAAGTGAFLSSQAKRLGIPVEELGDMALTSKNPSKIAARCTVFAESDMIHKAQIGHAKEDLVAGLCHAVVSNYLNNVGKGKHIEGPVAFQGGVSKNKGVSQAFQSELGQELFVDEDSHLMGALGAALLSRSAQRAKSFDWEIADLAFQTRAHTCGGCGNHCEIVSFYRDGSLLDYWGNRCEMGQVSKGSQIIS